MNSKSFNVSTSIIVVCAMHAVLLNRTIHPQRADGLNWSLQPCHQVPHWPAIFILGYPSADTGG